MNGHMMMNGDAHSHVAPSETGGEEERQERNDDDVWKPTESEITDYKTEQVMSGGSANALHKVDSI
jgi:hypothetical protein